MDNIKALATEWWMSKKSFQKTALRRKYQKGEKHDYFIHTSIQDVVEMYEAEHAAIREGMESKNTPFFSEEGEDFMSFKEELNKAMMAAGNPTSPILNSVKFYEEQIEKWTKRADKLRGEIKELETKSTWDKKEVRKLMKDSFHKGTMAEAFSLPIDFDADNWIEEEINKTINK